LAIFAFIALKSLPRIIRTYFLEIEGKIKLAEVTGRLTENQLGGIRV